MVPWLFRVVLCGLGCGAIACGSGDGGSSSSSSGSGTPPVVVGDGNVLPDAAFYFIRDGETGAVRETVIMAHNLSRHCPSGCSEDTLGLPVDGEEMFLLKLVFSGEVQEGSFEQGDQLVQSRISIGQAGCGVPDQISPDGETIEEGHPPGYDSYESLDGTVTIVEAAGPASPVIEAQFQVAFEIGQAAGTAVADHCSVLDDAVIE